jgi:signal transduction histidine kinase
MSEMRKVITKLELDRASENKEVSAVMDASVLLSDLRAWFGWLEEVTESSEAAVTVFSDMLNYDKIKSNTLHLDLTSISPVQFIEKAVRPFFIQARQANVNLVLHTDGVLEGGENEPSLVAMGDAIKLSQVVKNLVSNALKFTPAQGTVTVRAVAERSERGGGNKPVEMHRSDDDGAELGSQSAGTLVVTVTDSGAGLTSDNLKQLFQEGRQFNVNQLQGGGGSGLGECTSGIRKKAYHVQMSMRCLKEGWC